MAPRTLLWAASPIIALIVVIMIVVFIARRVWRYPVLLIGTAVLIVLGLGWSWWVSVGPLAVLGVGGGLWVVGLAALGLL